MIKRRRLIGGLAAGAGLVLARPAIVRANLVLGGTGGGGGGIAFVQQVYLSSGVDGVTTIVVTLTGTTIGNFFVAVAGSYNTSTGTTTTLTTNNGSACFNVTNALAVSAPQLCNIMFCPNNAAGGSVQFTVTFSATVGFPILLVAEFSGVTNTSGADIGIGNTFINGSIQNMSIATNGTITQNNQLVVSGVVPSTAGATGSGGSQIVFPGSGNTDITYQIIDTSGTTITHSYTFGVTQADVASIAAFSHP
jgi:hypothetical protein